MRFPSTVPPGTALSMSALGGKLAASLALVAATASIAGLGTFATFTSSTSAATQNVSSGTLQVDIGATGSVANRLNIAATGVAPGDTIQRTVDLVNSGSLDFASLALTTTASTSSVLDTDATNGLQMAIDGCSVPWTEGGTAPAYTYTCSGTTTSVLASSPVIQSNVALSSMSAATAGGTDHLRVTLTLPATAGNTFQTQSSAIDYVFSGTQRTATNR